MHVTPTKHWHYMHTFERTNTYFSPANQSSEERPVTGYQTFCQIAIPACWLLQPRLFWKEELLKIVCQKLTAQRIFPKGKAMYNSFPPGPISLSIYIYMYVYTHLTEWAWLKLDWPGLCVLIDCSIGSTILYTCKSYTHSEKRWLMKMVPVLPILVQIWVLDLTIPFLFSNKIFFSILLETSCPLIPDLRYKRTINSLF